MKRNLQLSILTFALVFIANLGASAQFIWQRDILGRYNKVKVAYTNQDTYYVLGEFFQTIQLGSRTLTSKGGTDIFLAHYKASTGELLWVRTIGGTGNDFGRDIVYNNVSNLVSIVGSFRGTAEVEMGRGIITKMVSNGGADIFVASYYLGGIAQMTSSGGNSFDDEGNAMALGRSSYTAEPNRSRLYVTGYFTSSATLETYKFTSTLLSNNVYTVSERKIQIATNLYTEGKNSFYAEFDNYYYGCIHLRPVGNCAGIDYGKAIYVLDDRVIIAGAFTDFISFINDNGSVSKGGFDTYVISLIPWGSSFYDKRKWLQTLGGTVNDIPSDLIVNNKNIYLLGNTGSSELHLYMKVVGAPESYKMAGGTDYFLTRIHTDSYWDVSLINGGAERFDEGAALALDEANMYVVGTFQGSYKISNSNTVHPASGGMYDKDIFVTKFDGQLNPLQTKTFGTANGYDLGLDINISNKREVLISGYSEAGPYNMRTFVANIGNNNMRLDDEVSSEEKLSIAPNPFVAGAEIVFEIEQSDNYQVEIRDLQGKLIHSLFNGESVEGNTLKLNIEEQSLKPGTYIITVKSSDKIYQKKIIKL